MLKEGDKVPAGLLRTSFESVVPGQQAGATFSLADLTPAGKTLVLFFYPKDSTPGCTREAQGFTASRKAIEKAGAVVVGVSRDSVKSHCSFRDKFGLAVPLLSDPERLLHEGFGAWGEKTMYGKKVLGTIRSTFLVKDGTIARVWPSVKVDGHIEQVIASLGGSAAATAPKAVAKAKPAKAAAKARAAKPTKAKAAKPAKAKAKARA
ncbi:MAG TPA: peroxiredoxin [Labilithrix sp.]|nr:peroxiredoxin [Labilithrix sp.]